MGGATLEETRVPGSRYRVKGYRVPDVTEALSKGQTIAGRTMVNCVEVEQNETNRLRGV